MSAVRGNGVGLAGAKVLVVEDELLITMLLEDILEELGGQVAGSAVNVKLAEELAMNASIDVAILDVNLGGDPVFPVAERLAARDIPFIFASGYGSATLPEKWQNHPTLPKPFTAEQVENILRRVLGR